MISSNEIKALVSLLDDDDTEVSYLVEKQIKELGIEVIPHLELHWEANIENNNVQKKLEDLIHELQFESFSNGILEWYKHGSSDLLEGIWLLNKYLYPELPLNDLKQQINQIYYSAWLKMRDDIHPLDAVHSLNNVLFDEMKFTGNTKNFHSPSNSMLNKVFESKSGNPISLSIIYILVAQKLGMPVFGVNLPSLFILTYESDQLQFYINPFNKGLIFSKKDIDLYLKQLSLDSKDVFYKPCGNIEIIRRSILNLLVSFQKSGETEKVKELNLIYEKLNESI